MKCKWRTIWVLLLSIALLITQLPLTLMAEGNATDMDVFVASEEEIPEITEELEVPPPHTIFAEGK